MKKVLLLAYYFPPAAASGSLRPVGLCRYLRDFGFEPHVVCADPESIQPPVGRDTTLEGLVPDSVRVDRIRYRSTLKELLDLRDRMRRVFQRRPNAPSNRAGGDEEAGDEAPSVKDAILDRLFIFPDHQKYWVRPAVRHVCALSPSERPDVVLATASPWSSLIAGLTIARRLRIPFVADFRDPWSRNPKPQPSARLLPQVAALERRVVHAASAVIANTDALRSAMIRDYPSCEQKIQAITNGFIEDMIPGRYANGAAVGPLELCHFGSVYPLRNPKLLLEVLSDLAEEGLVRPEDLRVRFIGSWDTRDASCDALATRLEAAGLVVREPAMPREAAIRAMHSASHLLILQQDFPLQIPAKLYEYIAVGRPMVVIGGAGATAELVTSHGLGVCCLNDRHAIRDLLTGLAVDKHPIPAPDTDAVEQFNYRDLARRVAGVLEDSLAAR